MKMDFATSRKRMVQEQLIPRGIEDQRVLTAFKKVPRHEFVPQKHLDAAYGDFPLSIGSGQTISQPYIVALMTQLLKLEGEEKVLEIGTGSGYQTAILAELSQFVYSIERITSLAERANQTLKSLEYKNVEVKIADGTCGWQEHAPYDVIIVTAAAPEAPQALVKQLKIGGRLAIPIGGTFSQALTLITKTKDGTKTEVACDCVFVPLIGKYGWSR